ncbi:MAG TPA: ABC transporter substrate-binding protein [Xanthobacteraceae bacterium]|nr:ABC transporter substrate-binding protein [Xanthobacteraceae bacterium]
MYKTLCAAMIFVVGTFAAFAQAEGDQSPRSGSVSRIPLDVVRDLAPTGKLRAAINVSNIVLAQRDSAGGDPHGITVDLARELARRLDIPIELVIFESAGRVTEALKTSAWDVSFLAIEPVRAAQIAFTAPYVLIEGTYMVPVDSPLKTIADVDRAGVRIGVARGSAYDLYLTRTVKNATLVRYSTASLAVPGFIADKLEAVAGVRQPLALFAKTNPNVRVMDGRFQVISEAVGTPLGRDVGARYLKAFVEEMKATGFVAKSLARSNQPDAIVAPPAEN